MAQVYDTSEGSWLDRSGYTPSDIGSTQTQSWADRVGKIPGSTVPEGFSFDFLPSVRQGASSMRQWLQRQMVGPGIFGGGGGGYRGSSVNLDPYRRNELSAMERLLDLQFEAQRTEIEGTIAQTELDRDYKLAQIERALRFSHRDLRGDYISRGVLDSGGFVQDFTDVETQAVEETSYAQQQAGALIGSLTSQLGLMEVTKAAQIASQRAQIERAYAMARIAGGG